MSEFLLMLALAGVVGFALSRLTGFTTQRPSDYARTTPALDIRQHLSGPILCEGVLYGPTGRVTARFVADMHGQWEGNRGILNETFRYDTGTVQERQWRLTLGNDGRVLAEADDLTRPGDGQQEGSSLYLNYRIRLPDSAGGWALDVTDWMYLIENGTIINRSQFRKFGIRVAELVATMRRVEA
jgi:hypothetical protein